MSNLKNEGFNNNILNNYNKVKSNIESAAKKSGRDPNNIKIIPVSKNQSISKINKLKESGILNFGESRVQELLDKEEENPGLFDWHFIGHLQRNKVKYLARLDNCKLIHSLDSLRLAKEINKRAKKNNRIMPVLVQINIAGDDNKFGFSKNNFLDVFPDLWELNNLDIQGLMTILPHFEDPERTRPYFRELKELKARINSMGYNLTELSMGMTNDYEIAVEEGATFVRIGREIFGEREYE
ncbi:MAG: YggS family pyridoxal phosphate-dependent enzyme [Bacillota bacterium]